MNRRSAVLSLAVVGAGSFFSRFSSGNPRGDSPGQDQETHILRSEVRLVLLDVSVKDSSGSVVSGLSKENFSVLENGRPQHITVFGHDDVPVTVGILVDESRSMRPKHAEVIAAALAFIQESNPRDETFILHFNDDVKPGLPPGTLFSDDIRQLRSALFRGVPEGKTALNDAVVDGLKQLEMGKQDKRTLVLISDGGDNASKHHRREMIDAVERGIATIHTIGLFGPDDPDRDPAVLQQLARISGGESYFPADPSDMVPVCRRIAKDIRTRYTVGYVPPAGNHSLRQIRVHVSAPGTGGLTVRTRDRYHYDQVENHAGK